jgi:predicted dehydrogenase
MDKPIRTAVFGLGRMGWGSHFEPLLRDERYTVVAVADRLDANQQRAIDASGCLAFPDAADVLARAKELDLELAVNVLPSNQHVEVGLATLGAGLHTVIEKPLASDASGVEALMAAAAEAGKHLLVHHNRRFSKPYCTLKQVADSGVLGRLFQLTINMTADFMRRNDWQTLRRMNGGLLRNHGTHLIDLALYVLDEPVADVWGDCKLICSAGDAEDHAKILFRTRSGCVVDITCSTACKADERVPGIVLYGTTGTLVSRDWEEFVIHSFDAAAQPAVAVDFAPRERYGGEKVELTSTTLNAGDTETGGTYYENVADVLRKGAQPRVPPGQALDVYRVIDAADTAGVADWRPPHYSPTVKQQGATP